jgi:hypothetical protein
MSHIEVRDVTTNRPAPLPGRWPRLRRLVARAWPNTSLQMHLHRPQPGEVITGHLLPLSGWVCLPRQRVRSLVIEAGPQLQVLEVKSQRPGAARQAQFTFHGFVSTLGLPAETELILTAVLDSGRRVPAGTVRLTRQPLRSPFNATIQPLLTFSFGRSGSSWTMRLLREHPQVVVAGCFPHEVRAGQYWARLAHFLSQPFPAGTDPRPNASWPLFEPRVWSGPGEEETGAWFRGKYVEELAAAMQARTEAYYTRTAVCLGRQQPDFFAEKVAHAFTIRLMRELYPRARVVFLVRDFRDMFCSMRSFNARRGVVGFGRERASSDAEFITQLGRGVANYHRTVLEHGPDAPLIRYEDLVRQPHETLTRLFTQLGLDASAAVVEEVLTRAAAETAGTAEHRTTASAEESIGRWRRDLSPAESRALHLALGEMLAAFGYEPESMRAAA